MTEQEVDGIYAAVVANQERRQQCHCAGCGAPLPASEAIVADLFEADLRCDLCWRAMLAATGSAPGGWWRAHELQPWLRAIARLVL